MHEAITQKIIARIVLRVLVTVGLLFEISIYFLISSFHANSIHELLAENIENDHDLKFELVFLHHSNQ